VFFHKTVATRAAPFGPDMHEIVCRLGLRPRPHCGSLERSPGPLAGLGRPAPKGRGGKGREEEWVLLLRGGEGRGGEEIEGIGGKRRGKGKGGRKGMAGPIPNPLLRV